MAKGQKTGGRIAGTPNKVTKALREMVLSALDRSGGEAYLVAQAEANPTAFMTLLGKVMPTQLTGDADNPINLYQTIEMRVVDPKG